MPRRKKINKNTVPLIFNGSPNTEKIYSSPTHGVVFPVTLEAIPVESSNFTFDGHFDSDLLRNVTLENKTKPFQKHSATSSKYPCLHLNKRTLSSEITSQINSDTTCIRTILHRTKSEEVVNSRSSKSLLKRCRIKSQLNDETDIKKIVVDSNIATSSINDISEIEIKPSTECDQFLKRICEESKLYATIKPTFSADNSTDSELEPLSQVINNQDVNMRSSANNQLINDYNLDNFINDCNGMKNIITEKYPLNNFLNNNYKDHLTNTQTNKFDTSNMQDTWNEILVMPHTILTPNIIKLSSTVNINNTDDEQLNNGNIKSKYGDNLMPRKADNSLEEQRQINCRISKLLTINNNCVQAINVFNQNDFTNRKSIDNAKHNERLNLTIINNKLIKFIDETLIDDSANFKEKTLVELCETDTESCPNIGLNFNVNNNTNNLLAEYVATDNCKRNHFDKFAASTPPHQYGWSFRRKQLTNIYTYS